jgi:predicted DNA-binding protein (MmcQ/YjbR family)
VLAPRSLRRACLGLPGAVEEFPFGEGVSVFKVRGKIFALSRLGVRPLRVSLKCEPKLGWPPAPT